MKKFNLKTIIIAYAATALVGCGDSETNITEIAPTPAPIDDGHDHGGELGKGRLAIADADQAMVHFFDLEDNSLVESIILTNPATALHASPKNRYAIAVQKDVILSPHAESGICGRSVYRLE